MVLGSFCTKINGHPKIIQPKSLLINGKQKGFLLQLDIHQSIESKEAISEMSYIFPTDNKLCIYNMKFQIGDKTIEAQIKSNKIAKLTYEEAIDSGKTVAMATQTKPGITAIEIGNIPSNTTVTIIMSCALTSFLENPSVILTKIPLQACEPDGSVTYLYDLPSLEINLNLIISHLTQISDVTANCEYDYFKKDDYSGKLTIDSAIITDENILIRSKFLNPIKSQIIHSEKASCISLIPEFTYTKSDQKEYVFLIDCSASMIGKSMKKAKESLKLFISKISEESYFNIIKFGSKYEKLFDKSSKNNKINNTQANKFIDKMKPNLGGTEMESMLKDIFKDDVLISSQRQIFLVTDGEVYKREDVVSIINENRHLNRIFSIGFGPGADAGFLEEIAEITNGKSDFLFNSEELPNKINEYIELSRIDAAKDLEVQIAGNDSFQIVPYPLPPLLPNVLQNIFISSDSPIGDDIMITAKLEDKNKNKTEIENIISLRSDWNKEPAIHALFAQSLLKKLTNDDERSIKVSLESGVLSKFTSYIAVSDKVFVDKIDNTNSIRYENSPTYSYARGPPRPCCSYARGPPRPCCSYARGPPRPCCSYAVDPLKSRVSSARTCVKLPRDSDSSIIKCLASRPISHFADHVVLHKKAVFDSSLSRAEFSECYVVEPSQRESSDQLKKDIQKDWKNNASSSDIIRIQSRDGFWDLNSSFINDKCNKAIKEFITFAIDSALVEKRTCSTLFAIAFLEKYYKDVANKWEFATEKGLKWLKKINSTANWSQIINNIIPFIIK